MRDQYLKLLRFAYEHMPPAEWASFRESEVQDLINEIRNCLRQMSHANKMSKDYEKQKLRVYYSILQKDKVKANSELKQFRELASDIIDVAMESGNAGIAVLRGRGNFLGKQGRDDTAIATSEAVKNSYNVMEFLISTL